jgi:hypothetical protein
LQILTSELTIPPAMQIVSAACILAGFGLGVYLWVYTPLDNTLLAHVVIGVITTAFVILQALAVVARPNPDSKYRCSPNLFVQLLFSVPSPEPVRLTIVSELCN